MTKYLTASELAITDKERKALIAVLAFLPKIDSVKRPRSRERHHGRETTKPGKAKFNMNRAVARYDCGTGGCIGGWMSLYLQGVELKDRVTLKPGMAVVAETYIDYERSTILELLFYPPTDKIDYDSITTGDARRVIREFLKTGLVRWELAKCYQG